MFTETGCYIDGSHMNNWDFTRAVILLAVDHGFECDTQQMFDDIVYLHNADPSEDDTVLEILDALEWTYEDALDYLNSLAPDDTYFTVREQSLYLEEVNA